MIATCLTLCNQLNYTVRFEYVDNLTPGNSFSNPVFAGPLDVATEYSYHPVMRAKHWLGMNYPGHECQGKEVRGICVYAVADMPWLSDRRELFANKFHLTYQYLAYDCLEERHRNRTKLTPASLFDEDFYRGLPTVLYSRKDGLR